MIRKSKPIENQVTTQQRRVQHENSSNVRVHGHGGWNITIRRRGSIGSAGQWKLFGWGRRGDRARKLRYYHTRPGKDGDALRGGAGGTGAGATKQGHESSGTMESEGAIIMKPKLGGEGTCGGAGLPGSNTTIAKPTITDRQRG